MRRVVGIALIGCLLVATSAYAQGSPTPPAPSLRNQIAVALKAPAPGAKAPVVTAPVARFGATTRSTPAAPKRRDGSVFKKPWFWAVAAAVVVIVVVVATSDDDPVSEGPDSPGRSTTRK
jgi:hypothetical protein